MATSSITKNFVVEGKEQVEKFANAIEESYQESLHNSKVQNINITHLSGAKDIRKFMARRKRINVK